VLNRLRKLHWILLIACCVLTCRALSGAADASAILSKATEALLADWAADPSFACTERDEVVKGGKSTSKTFEALMVEGSDYHFPLATNDQPLSASRHRAELIKLRDEVRRRRNESPSDRRSRVDAWKKQRDENGELLRDFPKFLNLELRGEETKDGRQAYVFAAAPKAGLQATTRAAKVLTGIEGKAWVDKETLHPMHVEFIVFKPVPVYGALATVLPGTEIEIGMTEITKVVWLIDRVSIRLNVSKLHVFKSTDVTRSTYTQYRPNSEVLQELLAEADHE
jgi:hypothetical protein